MTTATENTALLNPTNWVDSYGDYLYNYAYSRVNDKEGAEDLVQDTFVAAWRSKDSFQGRSTEKTWLISILKRKIIDHYRKASNRNERPASQFASPFQEDGAYEGHWILERAPKDWQHQQNDPMHQDEFRHILGLCLDGLPDKWRSVFVMKFMEEVKSDEVCKELGCTPSNLWVMVHRAKLKMRECIENQWLV